MSFGQVGAVAVDGKRLIVSADELGEHRVEPFAQRRPPLNHPGHAGHRRRKVLGRAGLIDSDDNLTVVSASQAFDGVEEETLIDRCGLLGRKLRGEPGLGATRLWALGHHRNRAVWHHFVRKAGCCFHSARSDATAALRCFLLRNNMTLWAVVAAVTASKPALKMTA